MHHVVDEVAESAAADGLFDGVERLLVGCSAGCDSSVLLDVLVRLAPRFGLRLAVAHLHHGWRGPEADADLAAARGLAEAHGLPFFGERVELSAGRGSREEVARDARLSFFGRLAATWPADAVALGHSADDQLETVILNLARGTGRRGLGGMRPRARLDGLLIVRPLLEIRRERMRGQARAQGLTWREDASNDDISLARNRLRRRLLGELQQVHPAAVANVARAARLLRDEEDWLEELAAGVLDGARRDEGPGSGICLSTEGLVALPRPLVRRVVWRAIEEVRGDRRGIGLEHVDWVVDAIGADDAAARDLPGVRARRERGGRVRFLRLEERRLAHPGHGE